MTTITERLEAFENALFYVSGLCSSKTLNVPGAVINRLGEKVREVLRQLKSDDIGSNIRHDKVGYFVGSEEYYENKKFIQDKLEFDKKIMK